MRKSIKTNPNTSLTENAGILDLNSQTINPSNQNLKKKRIKKQKKDRDLIDKPKRKTRVNWTHEENLRYWKFVKLNLDRLQKEQKKDKQKIYNLMADSVITRDKGQCRSHDQKYRKGIEDIRAYLKKMDLQMIGSTFETNCMHESDDIFVPIFNDSNLMTDLNLFTFNETSTNELNSDENSRLENRHAVKKDFRQKSNQNFIADGEEIFDFYFEIDQSLDEKCRLIELEEALEPELHEEKDSEDQFFQQSENSFLFDEGKRNY